MNKSNIIIVIITSFIVAGIAVWVQFYKNKTPSSLPTSNSVSASNIAMNNGKQEITIVAWAGKYSPKITTAKAWIPTTLKIQWKNAYGCESAVRIPQLSYSNNLTPTGIDTVNLWEQKVWAVINGMCAMGMYNFQIKFE